MSKFQSIRNVWIEGGTTYCVSIPSEIVKKLNLRQDDYLLVELVDDSLIVMKKHNPQFTKTELSKVQSYQPNEDEKSIVIEEKIRSNDEEDFINPLKDLDL